MQKNAYYERKSRRERRANRWAYIVLTMMVLIINIPFLQMIMTSFKTRAEAMSSFDFLPHQLSFENYAKVLLRTNFSTNILNSFYVSVVVTLACIVLAVMAGYAISRFKGRVFNAYTTFMLVLQLFPGVLMLIPLFLILQRMRLFDTHASVMLAYTAHNLPFSIWLLKGFFNTIPFDIEQAGMIDGCSQFSSFWRLVLPISMPGVSTVAIFTFINAWCEFTVASILLRSDHVMTMTVGLQKFVQQYTQDWPALMTAATISSLPTLIFLLIAQKYLVQGMGAGSVKG